MDKMELIGVGARFFLVINILKLPLGAGLNLISGQTLLANLILAPAIALGVFGGKIVLTRIPQKVFELTVVGFALLAGIKLCFFLIIDHFHRLDDTGKSIREMFFQGVQVSCRITQYNRTIGTAHPL